MSQDRPERDVLGEAVGWAVDHVEVDSNFEGVPLLFAGDPTILNTADLAAIDVEEPWAWIDTPAGRVLAVRGPSSEHADGPFVWVVASDDGPVESAIISPSLETSSKSTNIGRLELPSGRLIIGSPHSIISWGAEVDVVRRPAEFRVYEDTEGPLRDGYAVIVHAAVRGQASVVLAPGASPGHISSITIALPTPDWLPPSRPVVEPGRN